MSGSPFCASRSARLGRVSPLHCMARARRMKSEPMHIETFSTGGDLETPDLATRPRRPRRPVRSAEMGIAQQLDRTVPADPRAASRRSSPSSTRATPSRRRASRSRRPRARPTSSSCCSTTSASASRAPSAGPITMPTLDRLAADGLRYNNFHTTALCSPTRTALLTGRNHHVNNAGAIMELATAFPGNTGIRPAERRAAGRDAAAQRLQHRGVRQVPRDAAVGGLGLGPVRPLAHALGLRQVLRLHRRRDQPVGAGASSTAPIRVEHAARPPTTTSPST